MSEQPTNETEPVEGQETAPTDTPPSLESIQAELEKARQDAEKYKALMRSEEGKKKELFNELDSLKKSQMSEADRAIAEAEERGRSAARAEFAEEQRRLKLNAAAAKAGVPEEVLGLLDVEKLFVDGEINTELLTSLSGKRPTFQKSARDLNLGGQSNTNAGQLTRKDLEGMTPAQINKARSEGRLDALMRGQLS